MEPQWLLLLPPDIRDPEVFRMENPRLELLLRHPLEHVLGILASCLPAEPRAEVVPSSDIRKPQSMGRACPWEGSRGFLVGCLLVSCLFAVWSGAKGWVWQGVLGMLARAAQKASLGQRRADVTERM